MHCRSKALAENNLAIKIFFLSILLKAKKEWITSQLEHPADKWFFGEKLKTLRHWDQVDESQLISCVQDISLRTSLLDNSIEASAIFHLSWEIAQTISPLCCHHGLDICRVGAVFVSVCVCTCVCVCDCLCICLSFHLSLSVSQWPRYLHDENGRHERIEAACIHWERGRVVATFQLQPVFYFLNRVSAVRWWASHASVLRDVITVQSTNEYSLIQPPIMQIFKWN